MARYVPAIGLETHVELDTRAKLFCGCKRAFGDAPNSHVCPVCMGLPGALPTLSREAVRLAVKAGLALGCAVRPRSGFDRKHYFYPDLPKGYQITQNERPLCTDGCLTVDADGRQTAVRIERIHIEEDAGKLTHDRAGTLLDMNRCGPPLIEIVTAPVFSSGAEAVAYLRQLRAILTACGVSRCRMAEGELRCDVNVSLREESARELGRRTEIKNLNSFQSVERAISAEIARQSALLDAGGAVRTETLRFDQRTGGVTVMRRKESGEDYRFLPEPDLPDLLVTPDELAALRAELPELPSARLARLKAAYGLGKEQLALLACAPGMADALERAVAAGGRAATVAGLMGDLLGMAARPEDDEPLPVPAEELGALAKLLDGGKINRPTGKQILHALLDAALRGERVDPADYARERNLFQISDSGFLAALCREVVAAEPELAAKYRAGKTKVLHALLGKAMAACDGRAAPEALAQALRDALDG